MYAYNYIFIHIEEYVYNVHYYNQYVIRRGKKLYLAGLNASLKMQLHTDYNSVNTVKNIILIFLYMEI